MGIESYSLTAASNTSAPPNGAPEGMAASTYNNTMRQIMADIRAFYECAGFINLGHTHTYGSATTTTVGSDVTAYYVAGQRVRAVGSSTGTIYGYIVSSSYSSPNTTVTYLWDSGSLVSETLTISVGFIVPTGTPLPRAPYGLYQRTYSTYATNTALSTVIPLDDTIPQNTEGTEIITQAITPKSASSRIRVRFQAMASTDIAAAASAALFVDSTANALAASSTFISDAANAYSLVLEYEEASASVTARTYKIRVGPSATAVMRTNGTTSGRLFGGVAAATLVIEEII